MPVIKSSKKRARQILKRTARNVRLKRDIRLAMQTFENKLAGGKKTDVTEAQNQLYSLLDTATKKNVFHKNKTARRKAKIVKMMKQNMSTKPTQTSAKKSS